MKYDINQTAVVPYIIAERALWNVIETDSKYKEYSPEQIDGIVKHNYQALVEKSERLFNNNPNFRKQLLDKRKDMRYTLEMFMEHWAKALLNGRNINNHKTK